MAPVNRCGQKARNIPPNGAELGSRLRVGGRSLAPGMGAIWLQIIGIAVEVGIQQTTLGRVRVRSHFKEGRTSLRPLHKVFLQLFLLLWTVGFLLVTAHKTIYPVGCALNWWRLNLVPVPDMSLLTRHARKSRHVSNALRSYR